MTKDFKDIWDHFLKISGEKDFKKDKSAKDNAVNENVDEPDEGKFFIENFEKYVPVNLEKNELPYKNRKKNKSRLSNPKEALDLHGKSVSEALRQLEFFVNRAYLSKLDSVLVIVGKGIHSEHGKPIIKDAVINWIEQKGLKQVVSFKFAPAKYGGEGALIIKIKKCN